MSEETVELVLLGECWLRPVRSDRHKVIAAMRQAVRTLHTRAYEVEHDHYNTKFAEELYECADILTLFADEVDD